MESLLFFFIFSGIWAVADNLFAEPIAKILGTELGIGECIVGIILGGLVGYYIGPVIAFSVEQSKWSWIATICLIISSFIFS